MVSIIITMYISFFLHFLNFNVEVYLIIIYESRAYRSGNMNLDFSVDVSMVPDDIDWSDETWNELYQTHFWQSLCFYLEKYKKDHVAGFFILLLLLFLAQGKK